MARGDGIWTANSIEKKALLSYGLTAQKSGASKVFIIAKTVQRSNALMARGNGTETDGASATAGQRLSTPTERRNGTPQESCTALVDRRLSTPMDRSNGIATGNVTGTAAPPLIMREGQKPGTCTMPCTVKTVLHTKPMTAWPSIGYEASRSLIPGS